MWLGYRPKINFFLWGGGGLCLFVFYIVNLVIFASVVDTIKPVIVVTSTFFRGDCS